jgi:CheY-like chemotaxis protein
MTASASAPAPAFSPVVDRSSILIVDDMEENLLALAAVLGPLGQRVVFAHSGEEALKALLRQEFAVVLLDILMPGMDGFETAGNIKRLDQTKDVPIILLTGRDVDPDYAYRGYAVGAADFLSKPIDPWMLRTKVNVFLDLHRKNHQLAVQAEQLRRLLVTDRGESAGYPERLTEITWRLMQIESLLRQSDTPSTPGLAERISALEDAIQDLQGAPDGTEVQGAVTGADDKRAVTGAPEPEAEADAPEPESEAEADGTESEPEPESEADGTGRDGGD